MVIAGLILPGSGFRIDIGDFAGWSRDLAVNGPGGFYREGFFADYPPGYLYVLWALGHIGGLIGSLTGDTTVMSGLVKLPGMLGDIGVAALLYAVTRRWFDERWAVAAPAIYLFNPGVIFDSAVWGQVDSVGTIVLLAGIYALGRGWIEAAAVLSVVATLVKFQYGLFVPVVLLVGIKRLLFGRSSDVEHDGRRDWLRVLTSVAAGVTTLVVLILPFRLLPFLPDDRVHSLWHRFVDASNTYTGLTINAFNLWMNPFSELAGTGFWGDDRDTVLTVGTFVLSWQGVSLALFFVVAVLALWALWRRDDVPSILFVMLVLSVAFFALPTRVHERYLFPALAFGVPFAILAWRWRALYALISASFFFNIYYAYTLAYFENRGVGGEPMSIDPLLGATFISPPGIYLLSFTVVVAVAVLSVAAVRVSRLPWGLAAPSHHAPPGTVVAAAGGPRAEVLTAADRSSARAPDDEVIAGDELETGPGAPLASPWQRLRTWMRPRRGGADSAPPGRLTRRDVAMFAAIALIALVFRLWRLDTPVSMHFDEVYHARSAAEWIANFRFGANRDVYEWTHPMLAKYLIAAGIEAADPNKVVSTTRMDESPHLMAVAPERARSGRERSLLFTAGTAPELLVRDAVTNDELARWELPETAGALRFDDVFDRLLVGSSESGTVWSYSVAWDDDAPRASAEADATFDTGLDDVREIATVATGRIFAARGDGGLAVVDPDAGRPIATRDEATVAVAYVENVGENRAALAVATAGDREIRFLDPSTLEPVAYDNAGGSCAQQFQSVQGGATCERLPMELPEPPSGPFTVQGSGTDQAIWTLLERPVAADGSRLAIARVADGDVATLPLPGEPLRLAWNGTANIVYVAGIDRVWAIEPHGECRAGAGADCVGERSNEIAGYAVFDSTTVPGEPAAMAVDTSRHSPGEDHELLLVATRTAEGPELVSIDAGSNAFAWRLAGAVFGALLAGLVYLFAATLFHRRRIAALAGAFVAFDAMSFSQSRISMNDIFVAVFVVAAYLLFWQVWSGRWARSAWWVLPAVGVLIGLAAATKWVGFYALAGLWILVLARSDLGRVVLLALATFLFVVAGIGAPWPFAVVLLGMVALLGVLAWVRPLRIGRRELVALPASGVVLGAIGLAFALAAGAQTRTDPVGIVAELLAAGAEAGWPVLVMALISVALIAWRAVASLRAPESDGRWYLPAEMGGFAWSWVGASLVTVPLLVYGLTFIPYLQLGHAFATPDLGPGYGWSLEELHVQMFSYHFGLQAGHPASSPWWSWPAVLRPVWFYQGTFDGDSMAVIYNGGNLILFWLGVPAIVFCAIQAWRRQSLALALVTVAFAAQWLPWTRIERATFLYHYLTAMPFFMLALAYLADEALRRRSTAGAALGFGLAAVVVGLLLYPIAAALPMPDWYVHAFQALPPWNFAAQFPDPPQGERALISAGGLARLIVATGLAAVAVAFAVYGRDLFRPATGGRASEEALPESG